MSLKTLNKLVSGLYLFVSPKVTKVSRGVQALSLSLVLLHFVMKLCQWKFKVSHILALVDLGKLLVVFYRVGVITMVASCAVVKVK